MDLMCVPNSQWSSKAEYLMKVLVERCPGQMNIPAGRLTGLTSSADLKSVCLKYGIQSLWGNKRKEPYVKA